MKKIICCILCFVLLSCQTVVFASTPPTVSLVCEDTVTSGDSFDVYVTITENSDVCGGRITIGYDNTALEIVSIDREALLGNVSVQSNKAYTQSSARVSWAGVNKITAGGNLLKITFKAKTLYEDKNASVFVQETKLCDYDGNVIFCNYENATVLVKPKISPTFSVECNGKAAVGERFDVNINITDNSQACGGKFSLMYDYGKFAVVSAEFGDILSGTAAFVNTNIEGEVKANWAGANSLTNGGCLLKVTFEVTDDAYGYGEFALENCKVDDYEGVRIDCLTKNKTVEIKCSTETQYEKENESLEFFTTLKGCPESAILVVALYSDKGVMVDFKITKVSAQKSESTYFDMCEFDQAKIFVWDSIESLRTVSDVEMLSYK